MLDYFGNENQDKKHLVKLLFYSINFLVEIMSINSTVAKLMFIGKFEPRLSEDVTVVKGYTGYQLVNIRMLLLNRMYTTRPHTFLIGFSIGFLNKFFTYLNSSFYKLLNFLLNFFLFTIFHLVILQKNIQHWLISCLLFG